MKKRLLQRIISFALLIALTIPVCAKTDSVYKHARAVQALQAQSGILEQQAEEVLIGHQQELEGMVISSGLSSDAAFSDKVSALFTDLFYLAMDLIVGDADLSEAETTARVATIFKGLLEIDEQVQSHKELAESISPKNSFVAFAASILWDFMDYYDNKRLDTQEMSAGVGVVRNIPYTDSTDVYQQLDVYYPEDADGKLPIIVDIHGGGLMYGTKELNRIYASRLAARGYIVVVINYRLCPDVLYDGQVQDVMAAYKWVATHGGAYNGDLNNVYVVGDSAGGQLAFYTTLVNTSERLRELYQVPESGLTVNATGLVSGMYDMKSGINSALLSCILGYQYASSPYYPYLQPEEVIDLGEMPPAYIVTSAKDFLRPASVSLDRLLTEKGIEHQFHDWELTINRSSGHITSVAYPELEESQTTNDEMLAFFEAHKR